MVSTVRLSTPFAVTLLVLVALGAMEANEARAGAVNVITVDSTSADNDSFCNDGDCTLREAVNVAVADGDSIINIPNLGTAAADIFQFNDSNPAIEICDGCNVGTLEINGAGQGVTIIDKADSYRVLEIDCTGCSVSISNLTIRNGRLNGTGPGGGLTGVGARINLGSNVTLANVTVSNNEATGDSDDGVFGVGINNNGTLILVNSTVSGNFANYAPATLRGAGIHNQGTLTITGSTISGNSFFLPNNYNVAGGGVSNLGGTVNITNSTISDNFVPDIGGGAGIYQAGTGIGEATGTTTVKSSTIANNIGPSGVQINSATASFVNSIVYNPAAVYECWPFNSISNGNNLDRDSTCFGQPSDLHGNPNLGPLQNNGGPTVTRALGLGSIAIDKGDNADCTTPTDQRGSPRIVGGDAVLGKVCDIGAYEFRQVCRGLEATQIGNNAKNTMTGGAGNDVIRGNGGNDNLKGTAGNDTICGDGGNDLIDGGNGQDKHDGGTGVDTASFPGPVARTINLGTSDTSGEAAGKDLFAIENVRGSDAGDDITGSPGPTSWRASTGTIR